MGCCRRLFHGKEIMKVEWYVIFNTHGFQSFMCKPGEDDACHPSSMVFYQWQNKGDEISYIVPKFRWSITPTNLLTFPNEFIAEAVAQKYTKDRGCGYQIAYTFSN